MKEVLLAYWKALPVHTPEIRAENTFPVSTRHWPFPSGAVGERWGEDAIFICFEGCGENDLDMTFRNPGLSLIHFFFLGLSFPSETWGSPSGWLLSTEVQWPLPCWSLQHLCLCSWSELETNVLHSSFLSLGLLSSENATHRYLDSGNISYSPQYSSTFSGSFRYAWETMQMKYWGWKTWKRPTITVSPRKACHGALFRKFFFRKSTAQSNLLGCVKLRSVK